MDRGPDAQARARHGRLLRGAAAARLARPRGAHGLLAATSCSSDAIVLGSAPAAARRPAHDVWPLRRQGSRHLRPRPQQVARARRRPPRLAGAMLRSGVRRAVPRGVSGQPAAAAPGQPRALLVPCGSHQGGTPQRRNHPRFGQDRSPSTACGPRRQAQRHAHELALMLAANYPPPVRVGCQFFFFSLDSGLCSQSLSHPFSYFYY